MMRACAFAGFALSCIACDGVAAPRDAAMNIDGGGCLDIALEEGARVVRTIDGECTLALTVPGDRIVDAWVDGTLSIDGGIEAAYLGPLRVYEGAHEISVRANGALYVRDLGAAIDSVNQDRSLTWIDPVLLDDPSAAGLARLMRVASNGEHGGPLLASWFASFATTPHSERLGPQRLLDATLAEQGGDPSAWDLDRLPFVVTAVHNRIDLADGTHCGELRVSLASIDPLNQPFHLIFLFRQRPTENDLRADGSAHCAVTSMRWASLRALDGEAFRASARALLDETLTHDRLLVIETLEFIISPWEWRQWFPVPSAGGIVLENRPLFQTIDAARLNVDGPDRTDFLAWVDANASDLDARRLLIPERFRSQSARVNDGVPWIPLDLSGVTALAAYPTLRQQIEMIGCPACHATDADFVQTRPDRSFSPFYIKELEARADYLIDISEGRTDRAPFGPLQTHYLLPP